MVCAERMARTHARTQAREEQMNRVNAGLQEELASFKTLFHAKVSVFFFQKNTPWRADGKALVEAVALSAGTSTPAQRTWPSAMPT